MKFVVFLVISVFFLACSPKKVEPKLEPMPISDLVNFPQNIEAYIDNMQEEESVTAENREEKYTKYYFRVWNLVQPKESLKDVKWPFVAYTSKNSYGENLQPVPESFFKEMYENANFDAYAQENKKAITLGYTNLRLFPSNRPIYKDPTLAGEGFPFDYLQNSSVAPNEPLLLSHYSKDKEWGYVFSNFASGWIQVKDMVLIEPEHANSIQKARQVFFTKEGVPLYDAESNFIIRSRIGMHLSLIDETESAYTVLVVKAYKNQQPFFVQVQVSKEVAHKDVLPFTKQNVVKIINEVAQSNYGWGGLFEQRDCSSMLRDLFIPFGMWLPRNSYLQSKIGDVISLDGLSEDEKIKIIKEKAIPFKSLLYKKGHIVLYTGTFNDEIIILHNTWGIKTKQGQKEGRIVIGKTVFSTLQLGKEQSDYNQDEDMLKKLQSLNILPL